MCVVCEVVVVVIVVVVIVVGRKLLRSSERIGRII